MDNFIKKLKSKNIHIVGVSGTEGSAVLEFLVKNGIGNITAHDFSTDKNELWQNFSKTHLWIKKKTERFAEFEKLLKLPAKLNFKDKYLCGIMEADLIFVPSSWYLYKPNFPELIKAKEKGIEFSSLTKLYFELAKGKIISVTGTKGKGTTSKLICEILQQMQNKFLLKFGKKRNVYLAGNDRRSAQELDKVSKMKKDDILVLETSNRQLMIDLGRSPDIGVITNISPDHIDEHGSFEKYIAVKKSLFKYAGKSLPAGRQGDIAVLNYNNEITRQIGKELIMRGIETYFFSRKEAVKKGIFLEKDKIYVNIKEREYICDLADIRLIGEHNIENTLAGILAGYLAGAKPEEIKKAVQNFRGLPHRIEFIGEFNGIKFYDDLASTNPDSTIAALKALANHELRITNYGRKLILICGGDDKEMEYKGLAKEIIDKVDILILLPGTGTETEKYEIRNMKYETNSKFKIQNSKQVDCHPEHIRFAQYKLREGSLADARNLTIIERNNFLEAMEIIKVQTKTGDTVLISPACAYFQARYIDVLKKPIRNILVEKFR